jgi:hypothetical protein
MIIENKTDVPEGMLDRILRFVDPDRLFFEDDEIVIAYEDDIDEDGGAKDRTGVFKPWGGTNYGLGGVGKIIIFRRRSDPLFGHWPMRVGICGTGIMIGISSTRMIYVNWMLVSTLG